jgi:hypothetical protein
MLSQLLILSLFVISMADPAVGDGFADEMMIRNKAKNSGKIITERLSNELRIISRFTCSGKISGFIFGGEMINSDLKTDYPRAEIWRLFIDDDDDEDSSYRKISSVELQGYYQSKGIYQFNVSLNYENGDFLAVYQPDASNSHVILHYTPNISTGFTNGVVTAEKPIDFIRPFNLRSVTNQYVLIHPITSKSFV